MKGLIIAAVGISQGICAVSASNVRVAELLAIEAENSRKAGEVVRSYLLYAEAAKRNPKSTLYREQRNVLAPIARLLSDHKLELANIADDISAAEKQEKETRGLDDQPNEVRPHFTERPPVATAPVVDASKTVPVPVTPPVQTHTPVVETASISPAKIGGTDETAIEPVAPHSAPEVAISAPANTEPPEEPHPWKFSFSTQLLGYGTYNSIRNDSVFNPNNQLAAFGTEDFHAALRPDFKLGNGIFSFSAKPRVDYDHSLNASSHDSSYYLQEWSARIQLSPSLTVSYGREVPMWGPAMSVPASNPYFRDNGRNTPLLEVGARDFGRIVWQPNSKIAISYIANTALRRGTPDFLPFRPTGAVKADYIGNSLLFSGIYSAEISSPLGQRKFIGGYVQETVGQAFRFYVEGSAQQGNPGYFAQASSLGNVYSQTGLANALAPRTIVGGLAYTDSRAGTWTGEYIYNPSGYSSFMARAFYATAQDLSASFLLGGNSAGVAAEELAQAANPGIGPLRRHYAFGQYQRNGFAGRFDIVFRYTLDAQDRSGQGVAYITWNANDHFQFFSVFAGMNGSADTEFARYLHYQAQLGFRIFVR